MATEEQNMRAYDEGRLWEAAGRTPPLGSDNIEATLAERTARYGEFKDHANIKLGTLDLWMATPGWKRLPNFMKQSLIVIADKVARILNGDPHYKDNWHDIQGYAKLSEDRCEG